jgi:hypothetical protein
MVVVTAVDMAHCQATADITAADMARNLDTAHSQATVAITADMGPFMAAAIMGIQSIIPTAQATPIAMIHMEISLARFITIMRTSGAAAWTICAETITFAS